MTTEPQPLEIFCKFCPNYCFRVGGWRSDWCADCLCKGSLEQGLCITLECSNPAAENEVLCQPCIETKLHPCIDYIFGTFARLLESSDDAKGVFFEGYGRYRTTAQFVKFIDWWVVLCQTNEIVQYFKPLPAQCCKCNDSSTEQTYRQVQPACGHEAYTICNECHAFLNGCPVCGTSEESQHA